MSDLSFVARHSAPNVDCVQTNTTGVTPFPVGTFNTTTVVVGPNPSASDNVSIPKLPLNQSMVEESKPVNNTRVNNTDTTVVARDLNAEKLMAQILEEFPLATNSSQTLIPTLSVLSSSAPVQEAPLPSIAGEDRGHLVLQPTVADPIDHEPRPIRTIVTTHVTVTTTKLPAASVVDSSTSLTGNATPLVASAAGASGSSTNAASPAVAGSPTAPAARKTGVNAGANLRPLPTNIKGRQGITRFMQVQALQPATAAPPSDLPPTAPAPVPAPAPAPLAPAAEPAPESCKNGVKQVRLDPTKRIITPNNLLTPLPATGSSSSSSSSSASTGSSSRFEEIESVNC